jgi:competence protein ComEA
LKRLIFLMIIFCFVCGGGVAFADNAGKINLNTATKEQLVSAGIDEPLADGILELRKENDEFVDMEELMDVDGVDAKLLRDLKKKLYIEAAAGCNC